jgi:ABC-type nitrate/sulfonate/bicarbonate transport system permease component
MMLARSPQRIREAGAPVLGCAIALTVWIVGGTRGWASGMVVTPTEAIRPIVGSSRNVYVRATTATVWSALRGLIVGGTLAFIGALLAEGVPSMRRGISRLAAVANAAPWVAVAPCLLVVLGRDRGPVAVAAIAVFFFVFVSTSIGLSAAPRAAHDVVSAVGGSRWQCLWRVQLPACWPSVANGLQLAAPAALAGAIFGEWYGADRGLGVLLLTAMQSGRADRLWAASLLSSACGLLAFVVLAGIRLLLVRRYGGAIAQAVAPRGHRSRWVSFIVEVLTALVIGSALVALWWVWIDAAHISPLVVPRPARVWSDLRASPGDYLSAARATLVTAATAFVIGTVIGVVTALLAARVRVFAGLAVPVVVVLAATPLVALFPLFARVLGYSSSTVPALAATMVFFPVFVYSRAGVASAGAAMRDAFDAMGATRSTRFRKLELPVAVPHIVTGCRIAAGSAVVAAVVGESLVGRHGLGVEFSRAYRLLELPRAFGAAIVIVVVSVIVFALGGAIEQAVHRRWT